MAARKELTVARRVLGPVATRRKAEALSRAIDDTKLEAKRVQQVTAHDIDAVAEKYARAPSAFLAGVVGGVLGSAGGVAVATVGGGALILSGPLGLAVGVALGVLAFRGRNYWRIEKASQKARGAVDLIRAELNALPPDAPSHVREQLYGHYLSVMDEYARIATRSLDDIDNAPVP